MFSTRTTIIVNQVAQRNISEKILGMRIKAVTSIYKITKSMKMVSAAKMKGDQNRLENGKEFAYNNIDMIFKCD